MKNIYSKNSTFSALFGKQGEKKEKLQLAPYCLPVNCEDGTLLFNGLSRELILLENEEAEFLNCSDISQNQISVHLRKGWFLIPENVSGKQYCDQMRITAKSIKQLKDNNCYKSFTIMTTLECNARCFYCFERDRIKPRMSPKTAEDVAEFVLSHSNPNEKITLMWFGGEPLYNFEAIEIICNRLKSANREYISRIITNGYLADTYITAETNDLLCLKSVQITLDGTEDIYNRSKNYIYTDCISPFKKVIENIESLLKQEIKVVVRLNLGVHNAADLYKLVDFLKENFGSNKFFSIYTHRLLDYNSDGEQVYNDEKSRTLTNLFIDFDTYIINNNLSRPQILRKEYVINNCMGDSSDTVVITPEGKLTKCEHFSDREIIGDIYSDNLDTKLISDWKELQPSLDICNDCPAYMDCIRLKKCPDISPKCNIHEKEEKIHQLKLKILNTYNKWKDNNKD